MKSILLRSIFDNLFSAHRNSTADEREVIMINIVDVIE